MRLVYAITNQAIGYRPDTGRLVVVQHWTGFSLSRHALAVSVNDVISTQRAGTPGSVATDFTVFSGPLRPYVVTERQARDHLERLGQPRERRCTECEAVLPLGWLYCTTCGLHRGGLHAKVTHRSAPFTAAAEPATK